MHLRVEIDNSGDQEWYASSQQQSNNILRALGLGEAALYEAELKDTTSGVSELGRAIREVYQELKSQSMDSNTLPDEDDVLGEDDLPHDNDSIYYSMPSTPKDYLDLVTKEPA